MDVSAAVEGAAAAPKPASKKETSRIPLEAAKPRIEKAIPVAGMEPPSTVRISKPGETVQITGLPKPDDVAAAEKRKTSRISLDAVLGDATTPEVQAGTKTIRLKRPGEAPAAKVGSGSEGGEGTQTQRRTVVVKRAAGPETAAGRKVSVARAGDAASAAGAAGQSAAASTGGPHWAFGVVAIAATLVLCAVIYMFASQAFGPNSCWTQYSIWTTGPDLAWPGKLAIH